MKLDEKNDIYKCRLNAVDKTGKEAWKRKLHICPLKGKSGNFNSD